MIPTGLHPQKLDLQPVAFGIYRSTGDWWHSAATPVTYAGAGLLASMKRGKWEFRSEFVNSRYYGLTTLPSRFSPEQGQSWQQRASNEPDEFDTDYTTMIVSYKNDHLHIQAGKHDLEWGPAYESITISAKPPPVPRFGFDWQVFPWLKFRYNHAQLHSGQIDSLASANSPSFAGARKILRSRYLVTHRLEIRLPWGINIGGAEAVVYGDRSMELVYLMPFISFWSAQHFLSDLDNTQLSLDVAWEHSSGLTLYGVFMMDEWRPGLTFDDSNRNWFGWQYGLSGEDLLISGDYLRLENSWTDHRIYRHRFLVNDYYSHNYPIGSWVGPHAELFTAIYRVPVLRGVGQAKYIHAKRGELTEQMITDQYATVRYDRFSGNTESIASLRLSYYWHVWRDTWLEISANRIMWSNPGFDPTNPDRARADDVSKWSFNLGFYSNFSFRGYDVSDLYK